MEGAIAPRGGGGDAGDPRRGPRAEPAEQENPGARRAEARRDDGEVGPADLPEDEGEEPYRARDPEESEDEGGRGPARPRRLVRVRGHREGLTSGGSSRGSWGAASRPRP